MLYLTIACLALILDQATKWLVQIRMVPWQSIAVIPEIFSLTFVKNYGAAFGILYYHTLVLIAITIAVFVMVWLHRSQLYAYPSIFKFGLACALGGAVGNFLDRIRLGYVVDFFELHFWPVFNVADIAIVIGVGLIIIGLIKDELPKWSRKVEQPKAPKERV
jgi:signal peptidase II